MTWSVDPMSGSSFLKASFTGALAMGTITGTLDITTFGDATGSASIPVTLDAQP